MAGATIRGVPDLRTNEQKAAEFRGVGALTEGVGRGTPFNPTFTYEVETNTLAASFSVAPTTARKRTMNRAIKRLKAAGVWQKAVGLWMVGLDSNASLKNWVSPGTKDQVLHGAPTFAANLGWTANAINQWLDSQVPLSALDPANCGAYMYVTAMTAATSNQAMGATNAGSVGIGIAPLRSDVTAMGIRLQSAVSSTIAAIGDSDGLGMTGASRFDAVNMTGCHNGVAKNTVAVAGVAGLTQTVFMLTNNSNGSPNSSFSTYRQTCWYLGQALTNAQEKVLSAVWHEWEWAIQFGEPIVEEFGQETQSVNVQFAAYGFTIASVFWCLQAARNGKTAALIGGWRDRWNFGGMSSAGLGAIDWQSTTGIGGLPFYIIKRNRAIIGAAQDNYFIEPRYFQAIMQELLNPALNGGFTIPVYQTNGVTSVSKTGTVINSINTTDGRTITASQWHDGSYEMDLGIKAGCSFTQGREAAGSGTDSANGIDSSPFMLTGVDPWLTPGVPASGLINNIQAVRSLFTPALNTLPSAGTADLVAIQANNFRFTMSNLNKHRVPLPSTPPAGFNIADYEPFLRWVAQNSVVAFASIFKSDNAIDAIDKFDVNNKSGTISTDFIGHGGSYPTDTYGGRETTWKATYNWAMGLFYLCQYGNALDARITTTLQTDALKWGFTADHFWAPHENDNIHDSPQMYVREAARLVSDNIMLGADMTMTDGTTPRISTKTIATGNYPLDSHVFRLVAYETSAGVWAIGMEGGTSIAAGGVDGLTPMPLEIAVPKAAECTNLSISFCHSVNHIAMSGTRLEITTWQIGQSMGQAQVQAFNDASTIQAVNYAAVRTSLLANAFALTGETAPPLPQVN